MSRTLAMRKRVERAVFVSGGIVLAFVAAWYLVSQAVQGDVLGYGFTVTGTYGPAPLATTVTHTDYSMIPGTQIRVDFGDGTIVQNPDGDNRGSVKITTVKHTYATAGTYTVRMDKVVPGALSIPALVTNVVVTAPDPLDLYLYPAQGHAPLRVHAGLVDYHLFPDMQVRFDFGDGTVLDKVKDFTIENYGSIQFISTDHSYLRPGLYKLTATLSSPSIGFTQQASQDVIVDDQDGINFLAQIDKPSDPLNVTVVANDPDRYCEGSPITGCAGLSWIFSDGTTIADAPFTVTHRFPQAGTYRIKLDLKGKLTKEKFFKLDGKGGIEEVTAAATTNVTSPKLTSLRVNGNEVALGTSISIDAADTLELRGTGTPGSIITATVGTSADFMILNRSVKEFSEQLLVNPEGGWVWQPLRTLPNAAGTFTLYLKGVNESERTQVLVAKVTKTDKKLGTGGQAEADQPRANDAEIIPTAQKPTGVKGALVATGSSLPLMLILSFIVAGIASFLILHRPLEQSDKHAA